MPSDDELQRLIAAIADQESGGDYTADNGIAVGRYQVLKSNVPEWTRQYLGRSLTWQQFLADPSAQDAVAAGKIGEYYRSYGARGAAAAWYSGDPSLADSTRPQSGGPSIKAYVDQVLARMTGSSGGGGAAGAASGAAGAAGGAAGVAGWLTTVLTGGQIPSDVLSFFSTATDSITSSADFLRVFFQPATYVRIGAGVLGTVLIIAGIVFLAKEAKD